MTQGPTSPSARRRFAVSAPDWGSAHLTSDAVVAFVDDELAHGPHERAVAHVAVCPQCAADVVAQRQARSALRSATCPSLPSSLMSALRAIPQDTELPPPPTGLAVTGEGELVSVLRTEPRRAASAPGAVPGAVEPLDAAHGRRSGRLRFGTGAAVSGLALGALALGVTALPAAVAPAVPEERGVLDGPLLVGGSSARFALEPGAAAEETRMPDPAPRSPRTFLRDALR